MRIFKKSMFCIEMYCLVYEVILLSIWKEFDKVYVGYMVIIEINDVVKLFKKIIFIIDKLKVVCLYE